MKGKEELKGKKEEYGMEVCMKYEFSGSYVQPSKGDDSAIIYYKQKSYIYFFHGSTPLTHSIEAL